MTHMKPNLEAIQGLRFTVHAVARARPRVAKERVTGVCQVGMEHCSREELNERVSLASGAMLQAQWKNFVL